VGAGGLLLTGGPLWRGIGLQGVVWGTVDAGIALFGRAAMQRRRRKRERPDDPQVTREEARNLHRLLRLNAGLDVLYVAGGATLALTAGSSDAFARGNGVGVILQGAFLLIFDLVYAQQTKRCLGQNPATARG
jgi:hypothetical protein